MEYVAGIPLDEYCRQPGHSISERLLLFRQVCAAVQYAHQNLIIHRDIKPSNILVTPGGIAKLLDFGTAKLMADADTTATGLGFISASYASPEQLRGEPVSTLTDVFSLGAVLFEILTGSRAFTGDLTARISSAEAPPLPASLPGDLGQIVAKALAFDPVQRYSSVEQLSEDIRRYLDGQPVLAHPPSLVYQTRKFVRRRSWNVALAALFVAGMTAAVIFSLHQATLARKQASRAQRISNFLTNLLGSPDPSWYNKLKTRGKNVTIVEVLAELRNRIGPELAQDPDVEVELRRTIGLIYAALGDHASAREQLALALSRQVASDNRDPLATAKLYISRAAENMFTLRFSAALSDSRNVLALLPHPRSREEKEVVMQAHNLVANAAGGLGKNDELLPEALEALHLSRELYGDQNPTPLAVGFVGAVYYVIAHLDEAERYARESWSMYQSHGGDPPADAFSPVQILGALCLDRGDFTCALEHMKLAGKIAETAYGRDSYYALSISGQQALVEGLTGHPEEARKKLDASREGLLKLGGPHSIYLAQTFIFLGRVEFAAGNFAAAESYFRKGCSESQKFYAADDARMQNALSRLGQSLAAQGLHDLQKHDEGLRLLRESHQTLLQKLGADHLYTRLADARLASAELSPPSN